MVEKMPTKGCCTKNFNSIFVFSVKNEKIHGHCATPYKIAASTDRNYGNECKNNMKYEI